MSSWTLHTHKKKKSSLEHPQNDEQSLPSSPSLQNKAVPSVTIRQSSGTDLRSPVSSRLLQTSRKRSLTLTASKESSEWSGKKSPVAVSEPRRSISSRTLRHSTSCSTLKKEISSPLCSSGAPSTISPFSQPSHSLIEDSWLCANPLVYKQEVPSRNPSTSSIDRKTDIVNGEEKKWNRLDDTSIVCLDDTDLFDDLEEEEKKMKRTPSTSALLLATPTSGIGREELKRSPSTLLGTPRSVKNEGDYVHIVPKREVSRGVSSRLPSIKREPMSNGQMTTVSTPTSVKPHPSTVIDRMRMDWRVANTSGLSVARNSVKKSPSVVENLAKSTKPSFSIVRNSSTHVSSLRTNSFQDVKVKKSASCMESVGRTDSRGPNSSIKVSDNEDDLLGEISPLKKRGKVKKEYGDADCTLSQGKIVEERKSLIPHPLRISSGDLFSSQESIVHTIFTQKREIKEEIQSYEEEKREGEYGRQSAREEPSDGVHDRKPSINKSHHPFGFLTGTQLHIESTQQMVQLSQNGVKIDSQDVWCTPEKQFPLLSQSPDSQSMKKSIIIEDDTPLKEIREEIEEMGRDRIQRVEEEIVREVKRVQTIVPKAIFRPSIESCESVIINDSQLDTIVERYSIEDDSQDSVPMVRKQEPPCSSMRPSPSCTSEQRSWGEKREQRPKIVRRLSGLASALQTYFNETRSEKNLLRRKRADNESVVECRVDSEKAVKAWGVQLIPSSLGTILRPHSSLSSRITDKIRLPLTKIELPDGKTVIMDPIFM